MVLYIHISMYIYIYTYAVLELASDQKIQPRSSLDGGSSAASMDALAADVVQAATQETVDATAGSLLRVCVALATTLQAVLVMGP